MLSLHTHQPLLIQLHTTLYYRRSNATTNNSIITTANTPNPFHSQKLPPVTFAANTIIPSPSYDSTLNDDSHLTLNPLKTRNHHNLNHTPLDPTTLNHNPHDPTTPNSHSHSHSHSGSNNNTPTHSRTPTPNRTPNRTRSPNRSPNRTRSPNRSRSRSRSSRRDSRSRNRSRGSRNRRGSTPPDLFLRSLDNSCLARVRAMTRHTAFCFDRAVDYEVERAFVWAGVGVEGAGVGAGVAERAVGWNMGMGGAMGMMGLGRMEGMGSMEGMEGMAEEGMGEESGFVGGVGRGAGAMSTASLSMRGLSSAEIARQVDMMRRRGYRDWVRVEMAVEIEAGRELREKFDAGWLTGV